VPLHDLLPDSDANTTPLVRTEPVQGRSAARIDALLDAAAAVVDETGFDRLTTAMVSERAGASIGTVYRYFPDRIALLQGLRDRAAGRYRWNVNSALREQEPTTWLHAVDCAVEVFATMFRTEPGFRIIRFTDAERAVPESENEYSSEYFAEKFAEVLSGEYGLPAGDELVFHLGIAIQIADALVTRAFLTDPAGDERVLSEAHAVVRSYLTGYYSAD
jgi:AcrR family transcriptional regulator